MIVSSFVGPSNSSQMPSRHRGHSIVQGEPRTRSTTQNARNQMCKHGAFTRTCSIDVSNGHLGVTLGASPYSSLGGVVVKWRHPSDLFAKAGLSEGDIVLSFNEKPLSDPAKAIQLASHGPTGALEVKYLSAADAKKYGEQSKWRSPRTYVIFAALMAVNSIFFSQMSGSTTWAELVERASAALPAGMTAPTESAGMAATDSPAVVYSEAYITTEMRQLEERMEQLDKDELHDLLVETTTEAYYAKNRDFYAPMDNEDLRLEVMRQHESAMRQRWAHAKEEEKKLRRANGTTKKPKTPEEVLKRKSVQELQVLLWATGLIDQENAAELQGASQKTLREMALSTDALTKWNGLKEEARLEANRYVATWKVRAAAEKKAAEEAARDKTRDEATALKRSFPQPKEWWEEDWDKHAEAEALDRLRNLARWKTMTPEQMETTLTNIRRNKYALEQMENEDRMAHAYAAATEFAQSQGRSSISMEEAAEIGAGLGMRTGFHKLKEDGKVSPAAKMVMGDKF